jgi:hypothetical protein
MSLIIDGTSGVTFNDSSLQAAAASPYVLKNRIINGAMVIDQRNSGASSTPTSIGNYTYNLDRWSCAISAASKFSVQQNAGSVTPPAGFSNYLGITSLSAYSITSGDYFFLSQKIEGFNTADLDFGTANAKTVTLSFWVRSSLTGTFGGSLQNSAQNRSYPFTYTISAANTWEQKTVTIAGDTSGTWIGATNGIGIQVNLGFGVGSTYSGTAGAWATGSFIWSATGATSVVGTNGATFYITGVQLEIGSSATPFERRLYGQELANCQRYLPVWQAGSTFGGGNGDRLFGIAVNTTLSQNTFNFNVTPRVPPTGITVSSASHFNIYNMTTGGSGACTAITFGSSGFYNCQINYTTTAGSPTIAAGNPIQSYSGNAAAQIQFTGCEL